MLTLRPGLKPDAPSLSLLPQPSGQSNKSSSSSKEADGQDVLSVAVESDPNAIYLNLSLPLQWEEMDRTSLGFLGIEQGHELDAGSGQRVRDKRRDPIKGRGYHLTCGPLGGLSLVTETTQCLEIGE